MGTKTESGYLPGLDGLRALAVIAILIFHYWPSGQGHLTGGFIGVDIFFVLSGFLITSLLLKEWRKNQRIDLKNFWLRRARRLLPAVVTLLIILTLLAIVGPIVQENLERENPALAKYCPDFSGELATLKSQVPPALFYFINWHYVLSDKSYFEETDRPSLLSHLWSLSIEEQFYVLWPLIVMLGLMLSPRRLWPLVAFWTMLGLASAGSMLWLGQASPQDTRAYFGTDCRSYAFMLGAVLALLTVSANQHTEKSLAKTLAIDVLGLIGLTALAVLSFTLQGGDLFIFRGGLFMASGATALVIFAAISNHSVIVRQLLSQQPLKYIGQRSYGLYLWHWPIFILTAPEYTYQLSGWPLLLLRTVLLFGIVELSYRFVENPIRHGIIGRKLKMIKTLHGRQKAKLIGQCTFVTASVLATIVFCSVALASATGDNTTVAAETNQSTTSESYLASDTADFGAMQNLLLLKNPFDPSYCDSQTDQKSELEESATVESAAIEKTPEKEITAIGDSVMLGSSSTLQEVFHRIHVDATVSRQFSTLPGIIASLKQKGKLGQLVFIHLGNNGTIYEHDLYRVLDALRDCERVVFFNVRVPRVWEKPNNKLLIEAVAKYPNVKLMDWQSAASEHKEFFQKDGIHMRTKEGMKFYATLAKNGFSQSES